MNLRLDADIVDDGIGVHTSVVAGDGDADEGVVPHVERDASQGAPRDAVGRPPRPHLGFVLAEGLANHHHDPALREAERRRVPVLLTTGSNDGREQAERLGVRSMEKPFDVGRLLEVVRSLVESYPGP